MSQIIPLNTHSYIHKYHDFVYVGSHLEILWKAYIWFMWKYKIWVRPSPIHIQGRQSPGPNGLLAPNGTLESPIGTPPGLELLSYCYRFAQVCLFHHLPPTHPTYKSFALYIYIRPCWTRPHLLGETKAGGPFGAALISLAQISSKCICYLLPCPCIPLLFPIVHCLLGTVPAKVFFFRIYLLLFPWELHYAWVTGLCCCFCLTFCIR